MEQDILRVRTTLINNPTFNVYNIRQLLPQLESLYFNALRDFQSAELLVDTVNRVLETAELFSDEDDTYMKGVKDRMFQFLHDYTKGVNLKIGQRIRVKTTDLLLESAIFPEDDLSYSYNFESFQIPGEAIQMGKNASSRLRIEAFSDNLFFHWAEKNQTEQQQGNGSKLEFNSAWRVFSVEFDEVKIANLTTPVSYSFALNETAEYRWICAFWDENGR
jgi:hypothetical protein